MPPSPSSGSSSVRWVRTRSELIAYAADFVSFFIQRLSGRELDTLREVILFGSVVRGEADPESDIDIFLDTSTPRTLEAKARKLLGEFEASIKVSRYWKLLSISPPISVKVGELARWTALHPSMLKDGRVLYGAYRGLVPSLGKALALISWKDVTSLTARTNLYRSLHGYKALGRRYAGLLERHDGQKVSKGSILVPLSTLDLFKDLFRRLKISVKLRTLYEPSDH